MIETDLHADPFEQFKATFALAKEKSKSDATAMVLSTCSPEGQPSSRVVLLKGFSDDGFLFFTNYESRKSQEMLSNSNIALNFYWPEIGQQVRLEGRVEKADAHTSDEYYHSRPRISQLGAWASQQSMPLQSRDALLSRLAELEQKFQNHDVPRPKHWGGWLLRPEMFEFWYDGEFRLHDRFVYLKTSDAGWTIQRLNP